MMLTGLSGNEIYCLAQKGIGGLLEFLAIGSAVKGQEYNGPFYNRLLRSGSLLPA
jgi:hypothetical protein